MSSVFMVSIGRHSGEIKPEIKIFLKSCSKRINQRKEQ
jgi:hypothetical protein